MTGTKKVQISGKTGIVPPLKTTTIAVEYDEHQSNIGRLIQVRLQVIMKLSLD